MKPVRPIAPALLVLTLSTLLLVAPYATTRVRTDETTLVISDGGSVAVPDTHIRVSYSEGRAMLAGGGCVPFRQFGILQDGEASAAATLVGQHLGPWTVADVRWYHHEPGLLGRWFGGALGLASDDGPMQVAHLVRR